VTTEINHSVTNTEIRNPTKEVAVYLHGQRDIRSRPVIQVAKLEHQIWNLTAHFQLMMKQNAPVKYIE